MATMNMFASLVYVLAFTLCSAVLCRFALGHHAGLVARLQARSRPARRASAHAESAGNERQ